MVKFIQLLAAEVAAIVFDNWHMGVSRPNAHHVHLATTSLGIQISTSRLEEEGQPIYHYALSSQQSPLTDKMAQFLSHLILQLKHKDSSLELVQNQIGVFHLLVRANF